MNTPALRKQCPNPGVDQGGFAIAGRRDNFNDLPLPADHIRRQSQAGTRKRTPVRDLTDHRAVDDSTRRDVLLLTQSHSLPLSHMSLLSVPDRLHLVEPIHR
ncbi:MAG: hypothetical protein PHP86_17575 [Nevskiales bacterium]|nr:hypothetical protein [Nevskiales bacterium]